ncbi:MAG: CCA tRNA nucleotidyltransferase [Pseudomonadota bacterium]
MDRPDVIELSAETDWLNDSARAVVRPLLAEGQAYFVGGCVRDALLGVAGADVDIATDLRPEVVTKLCQAAGLKVVPTGIDHGTVTVIADGQGFEVTTFRHDVETDGRRAVVSFSTDIAEDARRRDFTLNALYATMEGRIVDPLGGLNDCLARRVRFIEDAGTRIREDYLRILRYFRFHAWYARPQNGFEADALDAIARNAQGLEKLSAERVGGEMMRLLSAPDPSPSLAAMEATGSLSLVLPGADDHFLGPVVHLEHAMQVSPNPILRLAALGGEDMAARLRLSRMNARALDTLAQASASPMPLPEIAYRHGRDTARGSALLRAAIANQPVSNADWLEIDGAAATQFPVRAVDLMPTLHGKALGDKLAELEARWIASGFTLSREDLVTGV